MPKVSVIMGVYNCEETVEKAIKSIQSQTYTDWEFIICDDGSLDNTYHLINEFAKHDKRIMIIKNESNQGLASTLNCCIQHASGKYIARMDADDISVDTRFEKQVNFLESNNEFSVVGASVYIYDEYKTIGIRRVKEQPEIDDIRMAVPFIHPTVMVRRYVYEILNGYTVSKRTLRGQDLDLWFRFYKHNFRGYNLQEPLLYYSESINDYKKRTFIKAIGLTQTNLKGYRLLNFSLLSYVYAFKPVISSLIPNYIMKFYHKKRLEI